MAVYLATQLSRKTLIRVISKDCEWTFREADLLSEIHCQSTGYYAVHGFSRELAFSLQPFINLPWQVDF